MDRRDRALSVLFLGHDASRSGSPRLLLSFIGWLRNHAPDVTISVALAEAGDLLPAYLDLVPGTHVLDIQATERIARNIEKLRPRRLMSWLGSRIRRRSQTPATGFDIVYVNSAPALAALRMPAGARRVIMHVHELGFALDSWLDADARTAFRSIPNVYVAASQSVRDCLVDEVGVEEGKVVVVHEYIDAPPRFEGAISSNRIENSPGRRTVLTVGALEWRKGSDLWLQVASNYTSQFPHEPLNWVWLGADIVGPQARAIEREISKSGLRGSAFILPPVDDPFPYYRAADLLLLPSREDPFPLVMLEAAAVGKPFICFEGSGGAPEFAASGSGRSVQYGDCAAMATAVHDLISNAATRERLGARGRDLVLQRHTTEVAAPKLYELMVDIPSGDR